MGCSALCAARPIKGCSSSCRRICLLSRSCSARFSAFNAHWRSARLHRPIPVSRTECLVDAKLLGWQIHNAKVGEPGTAQELFLGPATVCQRRCRPSAREPEVTGRKGKKKKTAAIESSDFGFKYSSLEKKQFCPGGKEKNQPSHCDCRCCCCWLAGRLTMDFVVAGNEVGAEEKTSRDFRVETLDGASDKEGRARRKCLGSHAPIQRFTTLPLPGMETINTDDNETCSLPMVPKDVSVGRQRPNGVAHPNKMPLFHSTRWKNWRSESSENVDTPSTIDAARR